MLKSLWKWISQERTRKTLTWLGGAVVVIAGTVWKVYTYEPPSKPAVAESAAPAVAERQPGASEPQPTGQTATARDGGIAINADGDARVTVQQSRQ